jgi:hypothetical protein
VSTWEVEDEDLLLGLLDELVGRHEVDVRPCGSHVYLIGGGAYRVQTVNLLAALGCR